jgi:hypothetical protein
MPTRKRENQEMLRVLTLWTPVSAPYSLILGHQASPFLLGLAAERVDGFILETHVLWRPA